NFVRPGIALGRTRALCPSDVTDRYCIPRRNSEPRPDKGPRSHVLRLFLRPDDILDRRIRIHNSCNVLVRPGIQLFHADECNTISAIALPLLDQIVIDLARAEYDAFHALALARRRRVVDYSLERPG